MIEWVRGLLVSEHVWWQGGVFAVLVAGLLVVLYLLRNRQMDFIYSLF